MFNKNINGYIEGFYGKLLDWESRKLIIKSLKKNNMNTFFYAPKEDPNHRYNWRLEYSLDWRKKFKEFANFSKKNKINIIAGIAPGLDFNFKEMQGTLKTKTYSDFDILIKKCTQLLNDGATAIALLLDDIPDDFEKHFGYKVSEGTSHAKLVNKISETLKQPIYFVPRIYADELIKSCPSYLLDLSKVLNNNICMFYCGKNVVCNIITETENLRKLFKNKIIYWDNYYANDYCPKRFFIGPYTGRKNLKNIMINPTGSISTDLLILDIITNTVNEKKPLKPWFETLKGHGVPIFFYKIRMFFFKPNFGSNPNLSSYKFNSQHIQALDFLLWSWKGSLSREWYPFLLGLKQDLQLRHSKLKSERIIKTQSIPLVHYIKNLKKGELE